MFPCICLLGFTPVNEKVSSLHLHVEGQILIVVGAYEPNNTKSAVIGLLWLSWEDASQTWQPQPYRKDLLGISHQTQL